MIASLIYITPDRWLIVSGIFAVLSFFTPKRIPLTICGTGFITATISFLYPFVGGEPLSSTLQLSLFSVFLILGLLFIQTENSKISQEVMREDFRFNLTTPIKKGKGTFTLGTTSYTLIGPDCPAGTRVTVVSMKDHTLYINPLETQDD